MAGRRTNVVPIALGRIIGPMQAMIRELSRDTKKVLLTTHAIERMWERDITDVEVFRVLRTGLIQGLPWVEPGTDDHACKVVLRQRCGRRIGVVTIILSGERLVVKTVEWEDVR